MILFHCLRDIPKKSDKAKGEVSDKRSHTKAAYIKQHKQGSKDPNVAPQGHGHTKHKKHVAHRSFEKPVSPIRSSEDIQTPIRKNTLVSNTIYTYIGADQTA